jgi:hypothetical protein
MRSIERRDRVSRESVFNVTRSTPQVSKAWPSMSVGKLTVASADAHRPPGRESVPVGEDRLPTWADFEEMRDAYVAVAPDPVELLPNAVHAAR